MHILLQRLIAIAANEVGIKEAGGNNTGNDIVEFQKATWLSVDKPFPWCAAFMCWVLREWLKDTDVQQHFGITAISVNTWRCRDASAFGWEKWAKDHNIFICDEQTQAKAGDIVVYDFSHIGIVEFDQLPGKDYIETIEGNTRPKSLKRDSAEGGDGVYRMQRKVNLVHHYIRLIQEPSA